MFLIDNGASLYVKSEYNISVSQTLWDNGYKDIIKSYHNAHEIIDLEYLKPYLITKSGFIIDVYKNKFIEPINNNLYLQVKLKEQLFLVHLLVANTFKPNEDKTLIVRHIDNNILNNNVDNLEWIKSIINLSYTEYICDIEFSEIPDFLHNSELYKTCLESGDNFEILKKYYKNDLIINSIDDFIHMLYTLRFWCIEKIPYELYDYVLANKIIIEIYFNLLQDIFHDFSFLEEFRILFRYDDESICSELSSRGMIDCLKYAHENGYLWSSETCSKAIKNGHLEIVKYIHENGCNWYKFEICEIASHNGHLEILKYAHENGCPLEYRFTNACIESSRNGHLACLKYAYENGCPLEDYFTDACRVASMNGHLAILKYAHKNGCKWNKELCIKVAIKNNHLECIKYIEEN
jgi:hypothetical protein